MDADHRGYPRPLQHHDRQLGRRGHHVGRTGYTKEFVDQNEYFSLCFFDEGYREQLNYCGKTSGRDADKIKACGFTVEAGAGNTPYFAEAELVLVCRKQYAQEMKPECMLDPAIDGTFYPQKDYHTMYIGQIVEAYKRG